MSAGDLVLVNDALANGQVSATKASIYADLLAEQPLEVVLSVCDQTLPVALGLTPTALTQRIRSMIAV